MNRSFLLSFFKRFILLFIVSFILSLPFDYYILPNIGKQLTAVIEPICNSFNYTTDLVFYADSKIMQIWTLLLLASSCCIAIVWTFIRPNSFSQIPFWLERISAYYLALSLLIYGFNKIFKYQFYYPEPNTLHTPLGQLSPDILFWSSMGTSYSYSVFAGLIEVIPAFLLLFKKTRMLGALLSFAVLLNVVMLNFGFDISVKIYSCFLLLLSLLLLTPHFKSLFAFFISKSSPAKKSIDEINVPEKKQLKYYATFKTLGIAILLFEVLGIYFEKGYFNGDNLPKPAMHGAYAVSKNTTNVKKVFFHSKGYFIIQDQADHFFDYRYALDGSQLQLTDYNSKKSYLELKTQNDSTFLIQGDFYGTNVNWGLSQLNALE